MKNLRVIKVLKNGIQVKRLTPGKLWLGVFVMLIIMSSGCAKTDEGIFTPADTHKVYNDTVFPVLWLKNGNELFQPNFPNKSQLTLNAMSQDAVYMDSSGLMAVYETTDKFQLRYQYMTVTGKMLAQGELKSESESENKALKSVQIPFAKELEIGGTYVLEITLIKDESIAYVYFPVIATDLSLNALLIQATDRTMSEYLKEKNESVMGQSRINIHAQSDNTGQITVSYTGAEREAGEFTYYDKKLVFDYDKDLSHLELIHDFRTSNQRYVYSEANMAWDLGVYVHNGEDSDSRKVITSENKRYEVVFNDREIVLYDTKDEIFYEVYKWDRLNSDYVNDEYYHHMVHPFKVSNEGDVYFSVSGYINDTTAYKQMTGIGLYYYHNKALKAVSFIERGESVQRLSNFVDSGIFFNHEQEQYYVFEDGMLYTVNAKNGKSVYIESYIEGQLDAKNGILYWNNEDVKYNQSINFVNLNDIKLHITNIYTIGTYKHLFAIDNGTIIVGGYDLEDTYEQLDGRIIYPYKDIEIYDFEGNHLQTFERDAIHNLFYGKAFYDENTQSYVSDLLDMQLNPNSNSKNSRISFIDMGESFTISERKSEGSAPRLLSEVAPSYHFPVRSLKQVGTLFMDKLENIDRSINPFYGYLLPLKTFYCVEDTNGDRTFLTDYIKALKTAKDKSNYKITKYIYSNEDQWYEEVLFESKSLKTEVQLDNIAIIPQRPELPRGCEVTSLSILLKYYEEKSPDKMELADGLKKSVVDMEVIDGFVHFSNMHEEFAGSMDNTEKDGLGVYIEPITELADRYTNNQAINVTGISFKQMLTFVSMHRPVLVIIPNRYEAVPDYSIEVWKTPSGYMEVTYQEHSVVVMGFDETYVYYSDPSKGIIDKKTKTAFEAAWKSMGSQAMMVQKIND